MDTIISANAQIIGLMYQLDRPQLDRLDQLSLEDLANTDRSLCLSLSRTPLKPSQFNYTVETASGHILYNTLYNSLSRLDQQEYEEYASPKSCGTSLKQQLVEQGFLLPQNIDEGEAYYRITAFLCQRLQRPMKIILAPTMECNARCFYCYEAGVRHGRMSAQTAESIAEWIVGHAQGQKLELVWFGGEPLLGKDCIDLISARLSEKGAAFSSYMITNGSLLENETLPEQIDRWHLQTVQITIDGDEKEYLRRKNYTAASSGLYRELMGHIRTLAQNGINVQLRLNIDRGNVLSIYRAAREIEELFGTYSNVNFYPAFLSGSEEPLDEAEKVEIIQGLLRRAKTVTGLSIKKKLYEPPHISACDINNPNVFAFDSDGDIYACERALGKKHLSIGSISGGIVHPQRPIAGQREECRACTFLPKCFGGCHSAYISGDDPCFEIKYMIRAYLELL